MGFHKDLFCLYGAVWVKMADYWRKKEITFIFKDWNFMRLSTILGVMWIYPKNKKKVRLWLTGKIGNNKCTLDLIQFHVTYIIYPFVYWLLWASCLYTSGRACCYILSIDLRILLFLCIWFKLTLFNRQGLNDGTKTWGRKIQKCPSGKMDAICLAIGTWDRTRLDRRRIDCFSR